MQGQVSQQNLNAIGAPDRIETRVGTLEFKDGVPTVATARRSATRWDFTRALNSVQQQIPRRVRLRDRQGISEHRAEDNTVVIFQE